MDKGTHEPAVVCNLTHSKFYLFMHHHSSLCALRASVVQLLNSKNDDFK
jgi:hypothetical protein